MDDVGDAVLDDHALERREVGDVAAHVGHGAGLVVVERERDPVPVVADVERDDRVPALEQAAHRPHADGAQRARDQDPAHGRER